MWSFYLFLGFYRWNFVGPGVSFAHSIGQFGQNYKDEKQWPLRKHRDRFYLLVDQHQSAIDPERHRFNWHPQRDDRHKRSGNGQPRNNFRGIQSAINIPARWPTSLLFDSRANLPWRLAKPKGPGVARVCQIGVCEIQVYRCKSCDRWKYCIQFQRRRKRPPRGPSRRCFAYNYDGLKTYFCS